MNSCELCGRVAPTAYVSLYRNIGMLVARQLTTTKGQMCRTCARDKWVSETALTFFFGWWGVISFFLNCFCVLNALFQAPAVFGIPEDGHPRPLESGGEGSRTGLAIGGALVVGLGLVVALAVHASGAHGRRLAELDQRTAAQRTEKELAKFTACDLVEAQLLRDDGHVQAYGCDGPLKIDGAQALLEGVTTRAGQEPFAVCLERGPQRWFVSTKGACAKAVLHTDLALSLDEQESAWRAAQARELVAERREALDATLADLKKQLEEDGDVEDAKLPTCSSEVLHGYTQPFGPVPSIDGYALGTPHAGRGGDVPFLTSYDAEAGLTGPTTEAIETLERTKLAAVIGLHAAVQGPKLSGTRSFEGGMFLGRVYLADVSKGRLLCSKLLAFQSSKDLFITTTKYTSESSKQAQFRTKLASDFEAQYRSALRQAVAGAFKPAAQVNDDEKRALQAMLGE